MTIAGFLRELAATLVVPVLFGLSILVVLVLVAFEVRRWWTAPVVDAIRELRADLARREPNP